ncbi:MAG: hypothetical protein ACP5E9_10325 [Candidatus Methanospirareceae archaeon]
MTEGLRFTDWKNMLWIIRIYAVIIIAAILVSDFTIWLSADTLKFIVMLMALFTLTATFQPYLATHQKAMMGILVGLVVLLLLGIIVFFLAM